MRNRKGVRPYCATLAVGGLLLALVAGCALFNTAPIARITASVLSGVSPVTVTFNALESSDSDGDIVAWSWDFGDGSAKKTGDTVEHTFVSVDRNAVYVVTLTVTDNDGATDDATQSIEVLAGEDVDGGSYEGPIASITANRLIGSSPIAVTFDASNSTIRGGGTIVEYDWDFGDGDKAIGMTATHTYDAEGTREFTATLMVWDDLGRVDTDQIDVIVVVADDNTDEPPTADVTKEDPNEIYVSDGKPAVPSLFEVEFDPRGSFADAGHAIEYYSWDFGDGSVRVETTDLIVTHVYELSTVSHTYQASLTVYDDQGLEDTMYVNITLTEEDEEEED